MSSPGGALPGVWAGLDELIALRAAAGGLRPGGRRPPRQGARRGQLSRMRGRGMDYAESRAYLPGDDIRHMDWRLTARTGRAHTKTFHEERERPVFLVVDLGPSLFFGTRVCLKSVAAARAAALVAWAAAAAGDRVGALVCSAAGHTELRPGAGARGVLRVLHALVEHGRPPALAGAPGPSVLADALHRTRQVARPGALLLVLSDFYGLDARAEEALRRLRQHQDLLLLQVYDPLEREALPAGRYPVSDGRRTVLLDGGAGAPAHLRAFEGRAARLTELARALGCPLLSLTTTQPADAALRAAALGHH